MVSEDLSEIHDMQAAFYYRRSRICLAVAIASGIVLIAALVESCISCI